MQRRTVSQLEIPQGADAHAGALGQNGLLQVAIDAEPPEAAANLAFELFKRV
ncbi:hypothetical protein [Cupriavidus basilensis]